jgi:hypothetical protein
MLFGCQIFVLMVRCKDGGEVDVEEWFIRLRWAVTVL